MLLPCLERAALDLATAAVSIPVADMPRSTTDADNEKPRLLTLQRPQPIYVEARSIVEPQDCTTSKESISITSPSPTKLPPAYAEARLIAPELCTAPSILYRLGVLGEFLMRLAPDAERFKVVTVDGTERKVVNLVIASLHYQIKKDLGFTVRVVSDSPQSPSTYSPTAISTYLDHIRNYGLMWAMMLHTQPSEHSVQPAPHPNTSPLVYILPLSQFMATLEASKSTQWAYHSQDDLWRWLASHWAGHLRPDVTVIVRENHDDPKDREVLRVQGENMRTLLVTTVPDGEIGLTPAH